MRLREPVLQVLHQDARYQIEEWQGASARWADLGDRLTYKAEAWKRLAEYRSASPTCRYRLVLVETTKMLVEK